MTNPQFLNKLVDRYYTNQITSDELEVFIQLQNLGELDEALNNYLDQQIEEELKEVVFKPQRSKNSGRLFKIAASVSVILLSGFLLYWMVNKNKTVHYISVQTNNKEEKKIKLSDGSQVWLNRNSALTYPEKWNGDLRDVELVSGEAYFEIKKSTTQKSFIVHAPNGLDISVIGTEFNVSSKNEETNIYLEKGKVRIQKDKHHVLLKPGELAEYNSVSQVFNIQAANGDLWLAWKNDMFFFDDTPLTEIGQILEEYYHKKVVIDDESLGHLRFTGKIARDDINAALKILAKTMHISIVQSNSQITMENPDKNYRQSD